MTTITLLVGVVTRKWNHLHARSWYSPQPCPPSSVCFAGTGHCFHSCQSPHLSLTFFFALCVFLGTIGEPHAQAHPTCRRRAVSLVSSHNNPHLPRRMMKCCCRFDRTLTLAIDVRCTRGSHVNMDPRWQRHIRRPLSGMASTTSFRMHVEVLRRPLTISLSECIAKPSRLGSHCTCSARDVWTSPELLLCRTGHSG